MKAVLSILLLFFANVSFAQRSDKMYKSDTMYNCSDLPLIRMSKIIIVPDSWYTPAILHYDSSNVNAYHFSHFGRFFESYIDSALGSSIVGVRSVQGYLQGMMKFHEKPLRTKDPDSIAIENIYNTNEVWLYFEYTIHQKIRTADDSGILRYKLFVPVDERLVIFNRYRMEKYDLTTFDPEKGGRCFYSVVAHMDYVSATDKGSFGLHSVEQAPFKELKAEQFSLHQQVKQYVFDHVYPFQDALLAYIKQIVWPGKQK